MSIGSDIRCPHGYFDRNDCRICPTFPPGQPDGGDEPYDMLRDAILEQLEGFVRPQEIAEEAILVEAVESAAGEIRSLRASLQRAERTLRVIGEYAKGHHGEQPFSALLHSLTIDIPSYVDDALSAPTEAPSERQGEEGHHAK